MNKGPELGARTIVQVSALGADAERQVSVENHVVVGAGRAAGIDKRIAPHTLRLCLATHLLEDGIDVRVVQALLGLARLVTTAFYTGVATRTIRAVSPLGRVGHRAVQGEIPSSPPSMKASGSVAEHALDAVALLVKPPVMVNFHPAV